MNKIMRNNKRINSGQMIAAIDIGGTKNWAIFRSPKGHDCKAFSFDQTREGYDEFYKKLLANKAIYNTSSVIVGLESTGIYGEPFIHYLQERNIPQVLVNPVHSKRIKEIRDNSPHKSDKKDPWVIADLIQLGCTLSVLIPKGTAAELRHLVHARERIISGLNVFLNQLQQQVWRVFPEFSLVIKSIDGKTALYLLKNYPRPEDIVKLGIGELEKLMRTQSRGQFNYEKAKELYDYAKDSVGLKEGISALIMEIHALIANIEQQNKHLDNFEKEIDSILNKVPYSKLILSIKGIGSIITAGILGELANFETIDSAEAALKLAGLNLFEISSGKHQGQKRISKRGRSLLRKLLYFAALNVIKHDGVFRETYQRYVDKGKLKNKALIAVARKLLRVIFALVRDGKMYDIKYCKEQQIQKAA